MRSLQHERSSGKKHSTEEGRKKGALSRRKKWLLLLGALSFISGAVQLGVRAKHARKRQKTDPRTVAPYCQNLARKQKQPYDDDYRLRDQKINARGPQFAFYSWKGKIQRLEFEQTRQTNFSTLTVKVVDNLLYARELWNQTDLPSSAAYHFFVSVFISQSSEVKCAFRPRRDALVFLLLLTLHFYDIPDLEMTFNLEDAPMCGLPFAGYNVDSRCTDKAGFTIPSYEVFKSALGPKQIERYYSCLDRAFPLKKGRRIMKAMWRGSTTGTPIVSRSSLPTSERFQLISLGNRRPDLLDVGFTTYVQVCDHSSTLFWTVE